MGNRAIFRSFTGVWGQQWDQSTPVAGRLSWQHAGYGTGYGSEQSQLAPLSLPLHGRKGCPWWSGIRAQTWWHHLQTHWDGTVRRNCMCPGFPSGSWLILRLTHKGLIFSQSFWNALKETVHTKEPQIHDRQEKCWGLLSYLCHMCWWGYKGSC